MPAEIPHEYPTEVREIEIPKLRKNKKAEGDLYNYESDRGLFDDEEPYIDPIPPITFRR